jgi:hypothetical protein
MPFDPSVITSGPICRQTPHNELRVSWTSSAPPDTTYQIYVDRRLAWSGTATAARFPLGPGRRRIWVGAVAPGEDREDFSGSLVDPYGGPDRARLDWAGGRHLDPTLAAFAILSSPTPLGFGRPGFGAGSFGVGPGSDVRVATVPGTSLGRWMDGFGRGGFGKAGFGVAEVSYSWTSGPLAPGTWRYSVVPIDAAGNLGTPQATTVAIVGPPRPPAPLGPGKARVGYSISGTVLIVFWNPSPP